MGVKKLSREILSKCVAVVTNHSLTPHDIAAVWDVFAINSQSDSLTLENWSSFQKEVFGKEGLKVYAVAGIYTTSSDLEYQPLVVDFMVSIAEEKPGVVLMMGPFVDMRQEIVQNVEDLVLEYENGTKIHVYETTGGKRFSKKAKDR